MSIFNPNADRLEELETWVRDIRDVLLETHSMVQRLSAAGVAPSSGQGTLPGLAPLPDVPPARRSAGVMVPGRHRADWPLDEEEHLIRDTSAGMSVEALAARHGRTETAIIQRQMILRRTGRLD